MENLKQIINDTYIKYFKEKNPLKNAYSEIKTQIVLKEKELKKELNDSEVELIVETYLKKIQKSIQEFSDKWITEPDLVNTLKNEVEELKQYVTESLSGDVLKEKVKEMIDSWISNLGEFMKKLNDLGKVDKKQAKEFYDELTNK